MAEACMVKRWDLGCTRESSPPPVRRTGNNQANDSGLNPGLLD